MASDFRLWINGVKTGDTTIRTIYTDPNTGKRTLASKGNLTNFTSGLAAGTYLFHWEFWLNGSLTLQGDTPVVAQTCTYGTKASGDGAGIYCAAPPA